MPATNECIDWATVRAQIAAGQLKWGSSDPGIGTLPDHRVNTAGEFNTYIKNNGNNPYASARAMEWSTMQTYRRLTFSNYALRPASSGSAFSSGSMVPPAAATVMVSVRKTGSVLGTILDLQGSANGFALTSFVSAYTSGGGVSKNLNALLTANTWTNVAAVFGGGSNGGVQLFINGSLVWEDQTSAYAGGGGTPFTYGPGRANGANSGLLTCDIDELSFWSVALTASQIAAQTGNPVTSSTNVIGYWSLENSLAATYGTGLTNTVGSGYSFVTDTGV